MFQKNLPQKIKSFLSEVRQETKKVSWSTRKKTVKYTLIVVGVSVLVAAFLGGLDFFLQRMLIF